MTDVHLRIRVLLSLQTALLCEVPPALRAVQVKWDEAIIEIKCYFDGPVADEDAESMSCVQTEVIADFYPERNVELTILSHDGPLPQEPGYVPVYRRREY